MQFSSFSKTAEDPNPFMDMFVRPYTYDRKSM